MKTVYQNFILSSHNIILKVPDTSTIPGNFLTLIPTHPTDPPPKHINPVFLVFSFLHQSTGFSYPPHMHRCLGNSVLLTS